MQRDLPEIPYLIALLLRPTLDAVKATLTSKGQVTIPISIRNRLRLKPGDQLEFDETAPFLKAIKTVPPEAWEAFGRETTDPWNGLRTLEILEELRGPVDLPGGKQPLEATSQCAPR